MEFPLGTKADGPTRSSTARFTQFTKWMDGAPAAKLTGCHPVDHHPTSGDHSVGRIVSNRSALRHTVRPAASIVRRIIAPFASPYSSAFARNGCYFAFHVWTGGAARGKYDNPSPIPCGWIDKQSKHPSSDVGGSQRLWRLVGDGPISAGGDGGALVDEFHTAPLSALFQRVWHGDAVSQCVPAKCRDMEWHGVASAGKEHTAADRSDSELVGRRDGTKGDSGTSGLASPGTCQRTASRGGLSGTLVRTDNGSLQQLRPGHRRCCDVRGIWWSTFSTIACRIAAAGSAVTLASSVVMADRSAAGKTRGFIDAE